MGGAGCVAFLFRLAATRKRSLPRKNTKVPWFLTLDLDMAVKMIANQHSAVSLRIHPIPQSCYAYRQVYWCDKDWGFSCR
jgi:hypothetical protein